MPSAGSQLDTGSEAGTGERARGTGRSRSQPGVKNLFFGRVFVASLVERTVDRGAWFMLVAGPRSAVVEPAAPSFQPAEAANGSRNSNGVVVPRPTRRKTRGEPDNGKSYRCAPRTGARARPRLERGRRNAGEDRPSRERSGGRKIEAEEGQGGEDYQEDEREEDYDDDEAARERKRESM